MHWYDGTTGEPRYEIPYANGKPGVREPTLADAKKLKLVPGVTSVLEILARPGLDNWKVEQAILAALTHPKLDGLTDQEMLAVIRRDAQEQARKAAERGAAIHDAIEKYMSEISETNADYLLLSHKYAEHVLGAVKCLSKNCGPQKWIAEAHLPGGLGYGGRVDLHSDEWVIDFKTKEFTQADVDAGKIKGWPEQHVQLVAYDFGLRHPWGPRRRLANIFVSVTEPGLCLFLEWPETAYDTAVSQWLATLKAWYVWKNPNGELLA